MNAALDWLAPAANGEAAAQEWLAAGIVEPPRAPEEAREGPAREWLATEPRDTAEASAQQWIQNIGGNAAAGAAMIGPWGLAIGAILGALQTALAGDTPAGVAVPEPPPEPPSAGPPHDPRVTQHLQALPSTPLRPIATAQPSGTTSTAVPDVIGQILTLIPGIADLLRRPVVPPSGAAQAAPLSPLAPATPGEAIDDHGIDEAVPEAYAARGSVVTPDYPLAARFVPAAAGNFQPGSGRRAIRRVVIHITDSGPAISETIDWFQEPAAQVSAHYVIGQDGEVVQMVRQDDVAWHARGANADSIGVEHVANTRGMLPTVVEYVSSAGLVRWLCDQYGIPLDRRHIVGHSEVAQTDHAGCPNAVWDWDYYLRLVTSAASMPRREP